jgi:hypothetical protein
MARSITITTKGLRELQQAIKYMETSVGVDDLKPVLAQALTPVRDEALRNLRAKVRTGGPLRLRGQEHIEDALVVEKGKSARTASAWLKVFRRLAPQGIWVEFGHVLWRGGRRRQGTGRQVGAVSPLPFFKPAIDSKRADVRRAINQGIQSLLKRRAALAGGHEAPGTEPEETGGLNG